MSRTDRIAVPVQIFALLGSLNALLAVVAGAYGAHALNMRVDADRAALFQTALQYHMFHALGLFAVSGMFTYAARVALAWAGGLMAVGIVLFCGSLYVSALAGYRTGVAPAGGMAFIIAWFLFAVAVVSGIRWRKRG